MNDKQLLYWIYTFVVYSHRVLCYFITLITKIAKNVVLKIITTAAAAAAAEPPNKEKKYHHDSVWFGLVCVLAPFVFRSINIFVIVRFI